MPIHSRIEPVIYSERTSIFRPKRRAASRDLGRHRPNNIFECGHSSEPGGAWPKILRKSWPKVAHNLARMPPMRTYENPWISMKIPAPPEPPGLKIFRGGENYFSQKKLSAFTIPQN